MFGKRKGKMMMSREALTFTNKFRYKRKDIFILIEFMWVMSLSNGVVGKAKGGFICFDSN